MTVCSTKLRKHIRGATITSRHWPKTKLQLEKYFYIYSRIKAWREFVWSFLCISKHYIRATGMSIIVVQLICIGPLFVKTNLYNYWNSNCLNSTKSLLMHLIWPKWTFCTNRTIQQVIPPPSHALIKFVIFLVFVAKGLTARQSYRPCKVKNCVDPRLKSNAIIKIQSSYEQYSVRRCGER